MRCTAEQTGLILRLGDWVLRQGCAALLRLQQACKIVPVSINIGPRQFRQPDFMQQVAAILLETGSGSSKKVNNITKRTIDIFTACHLHVL